MIKFITLLLLACSFNVNASVVVSGSFEATQSCPAYLSKNSKSNPDHKMVMPSQSYPLREINRTYPDWLRIELSDSHQELRWVSADCGIANYQAGSSGGCDHNPGRADAYVLALSSQPGFCQTYGYEAGKPECLNLSSTAFQSHHMVLHGFWPNQDACGQHYGYCGVKSRSNHCDYSPVNLSPVVANNLKSWMPSYNYGSCLERHEWNKHGSCQVLSSNDYFSLAMRLAAEADQTAFGEFLTKHYGDVVKLSDLRDAINQSFGVSNAGKVHLGCKRGILVDIFIVLPALIPFDESLSSLVNKSPDYNYHDACPKNVTISDFNNQSWF